MLPEAFFQAAWQQKSRGALLFTSEGERVQILEPGKLNRSDGPDFKDALIRKDGLLLSGDIELHHKSADWYNHGHHTNARYNQVILHVVSHETAPSPVMLENGRFVPTAVFSTEPVSAQSKPLYCQPFWGQALAPAFRTAVKQSKIRYLEQMFSRLSAWIPEGASPSQLLLACAAGGASEILGGSYNKFWLSGIAKTVLSNTWIGHDSPQPFTDTKTAVNVKGVRPNARPERRLGQWLDFCGALQTLSITKIAGVPPETSWFSLLGSWKNKPGQATLETLFQLVWIPTLMLLAEQLKAEQWRSQLFQAWERHEHPVPDIIASRFRSSGIQIKRNTGLIFQVKHCCDKMKCSGCPVFSSILQQSDTLT